jgi:ATP sulfurylase
VISFLVRNNYGFTHFIEGPKHAGVSNYYDTYDERDMLDRLLQQF